MLQFKNRWLISWVLFAGTTTFGGESSRMPLIARSSTGVTESFRMSAEFEPQSALLVAAGMLSKTAPKTLVSLVEATHGAVPVVLMANDVAELVNIRRALGETASDHCKLIFVAHDTVWVRDYGPICLQSHRSAIFFDAFYDYPNQHHDETVPTSLAKTFRVRVRSNDCRIPGGNLLTNGDRLAMVTDTLLAENPAKSKLEIERMLSDMLDFQQIIWFESLIGELTGHVDMFASFLDRTTVVVGELNREIDPRNAAILDRNALLLAKNVTNRATGQRLKVVRVPMPARIGTRWPTYTNVVFANKRLLVPRYKTSSKAELAKVQSIYSELLPGWEIFFLDADALLEAGGSLHCIVLNLGCVRISDGRGNSSGMKVGAESQNYRSGETVRRLKLQ